MNTYCVPYALAKLSGKSPDDIAELIRSDRGGGRVARVYGFESMKVMDILGIKVTAEVRKPGMCIAKWAGVRILHGDTSAWIIGIAGHMMLYRQGKFYDNSNPTGVDVFAYKHGRSRLQRARQVDAWNDANPYHWASNAQAA